MGAQVRLELRQPDPAGARRPGPELARHEGGAAPAAQVAAAAVPAPRVLVADRWPSYGPAKRAVMSGVEHRRHKGLTGRPSVHRSRPNAGSGRDNASCPRGRRSEPSLATTRSPPSSIAAATTSPPAGCAPPGRRRSRCGRISAVLSLPPETLPCPAFGMAARWPQRRQGRGPLHGLHHQPDSVAVWVRSRSRVSMARAARSVSSARLAGLMAGLGTWSNEQRAPRRCPVWAQISGAHA